MAEKNDGSDRLKKPSKMSAPGDAAKRPRLQRAVSRPVVVEKKRFIKIAGKFAVKKAGAKKTTSKTTQSAKEKTAARPIETKSGMPPKRKAPSKKPQPGGMVLRPLTEKEKKARASVLTQAKKREQEERARAEAKAKVAAQETENKTREEEKARQRAETLRVQRQKEEEAKQRAEMETAKHSEGEAESKKRAPSQRRPTERRGRQSKLTITNALDESERQQSLSALRRRRQKQRPKIVQSSEKKHIVRNVVIPETISVVDLAMRMAIRTNDVVKFLLTQDILVKANDNLDADTAQLVAEEFGHNPKRVTEADVEEAIDITLDKPEEMKPRAPVVTIMGHVDHGKTSLLDALRQTAVAKGEAGGITQHIGAYQTQFKNGRNITFIDTPGHAAFTAMRARGAKTTDIIVIVIAADSGVMPQTIESINHAKAAATPIIIALNKMDTAGADPGKIMHDLLQHNVICEPQGGEVLAVEISAKTGAGLEQLAEVILLQADLLEIKANPDRAAQGVVLEAHLDKGAGNVATVLVQRGTLHRGDVFVVGQQWGKVRRMKAYDGNDLKAAAPSCPVWVTGLSAPVEAGDSFDCVENESRAREIAEYRQRKKANMQAAKPPRSIEQMFGDENQKTAMNFIIKTDVQGSADAIRQVVQALNSDELEIKVVHAGVGEVSLSDVMLAETVAAKILLFNTHISAEAQKAARQAGLNLRRFDVIYDLIDEVKTQAVALLGPLRQETVLGHAQILELFKVGKKNVAAGCKVGDGQVKKDAHVRIRREDVIIHEGMIQSLRHFKETVNAVQEGQECGMVFESPPPLHAGDQIECFLVEEIERRIE